MIGALIRRLRVGSPRRLLPLAATLVCLLSSQAAHADLVLPGGDEASASGAPSIARPGPEPRARGVFDAPAGHGLAAMSAAASSALSSSSLGVKLLELGDQLRSGPHNVASDDGEKVIWLIRSVPKADDATRTAVLRKLADLARQQVPEALTFMGFAAENGIFGVERSPLKAAALYSAAAQKGYQPALYDLALMAAYGRGRARDLGAADQLLRTALSVGSDRSGRVCGMASFIAWRRHDLVGQGFASRDCDSPLAGLAIAASRPGVRPSLTAGLAQQLRASLFTGVDDALFVLESLAARDAADDTSFTYCRWALVHRFWTRPDTEGLAESAAQCVETMAKPNSSVARLAPVARQMAATGLTLDVPSEIHGIKVARKSNTFRYGMAVPYLPFGQDDVDLFASVLTIQGGGS